MLDNVPIISRRKHLMFKLLSTLCYSLKTIKIIIYSYMYIYTYNTFVAFVIMINIELRNSWAINMLRVFAVVCRALSNIISSLVF